MKDWYGNEYVKSSWTRFVFLWQCIGFSERRMGAFRVWLENTRERMQIVYKSPVTLTLIESGQYGGAELRGVFTMQKFPGKMASVTIPLYDTVTKEGLDPAPFVLAHLLAYNVEMGNPVETN